MQKLYNLHPVSLDVRAHPYQMVECTRVVCTSWASRVVVGMVFDDSCWCEIRFMYNIQLGQPLGESRENFFVFSRISSQSASSNGPTSSSHLFLAVSMIRATEQILNILYKVEINLEGSSPVITSTMVNVCGLGKLGLKGVMHLCISEYHI